MFGTCRLEYRCEVKQNLFTHLLFDWGTAWEATNLNYHKLINDAPIGIGIGLSYLTVLGPVRISYGQLLKNSRVYLNKQSEFFYFSAGYDF
jgi:outer membrane translocation and assembly module TamA